MKNGLLEPGPFMTIRVSARDGGGYPAPTAFLDAGDDDWGRMLSFIHAECGGEVAVVGVRTEDPDTSYFSLWCENEKCNASIKMHHDVFRGDVSSLSLYGERWVSGAYQFVLAYVPTPIPEIVEGPTSIEVQVPRTVEEIRHGYEYKGTITIGGVVFEYHASFPEHIRSLSPTDFDPPGLQEDRRLFVLELKQNGTVLKLTDFEWANFSKIIGEIIGDLYYYPSLGAKQKSDISERRFGTALAQMYTERFGCIFADAA